MTEPILFFFGCLCLLFQESLSDPLVQNLEREYIAMLETDPKRSVVEEAEQLLKQTNRSNYWTDYIKACKLLSNARSKSSIPLLMKFMIVHASGDTGGDPRSYAATIETLTGHKIEWDVTNPKAQRMAVETAVGKAYQEWWKPNRDKISMLFSDWPKVRLRQYVKGLKGRVRDIADSNQDFDIDKPFRLTQFFTASIQRLKSSHRGATFENQIHPVMLPMMLEEAGYRSGASTPQNDWASSKLPVEYIPFVASFRRNGVAPQLEQIARDYEQPASVRILCVLSLYVAGEQLMDEVLLEIAEQDLAVQNRVIAILSLSHSPDYRLVGNRLVKYLDDANVEITLAAIHGMMESKPPMAIPKLNELLQSDRIGKENSSVLRLLGEMKSRESEKVLFDFLQRSLDEPRYRDSIYSALSAFSTACGVSWTEAGAHDTAYYEQSARKAVRWWQAKEKARIALLQLDEKDFSYHGVSLNAGADLKGFYKLVIEAIFTNSNGGLDNFLLPAGGLDSRRFLKSREVWRNDFEVIPLEIRQLSEDVVVINTPSHSLTVVRTSISGLKLLDIADRSISPAR